MIAVIAAPSERPVIAEFFELFKTPWEFYRAGQRYEVVLCAEGDEIQGETAYLVLTYAGRRIPSDCQANVHANPRTTDAHVLCYEGMRIPIYGDYVTFPGNTIKTLVDEETGESALDLNSASGIFRARIGYDLFREIQILLTTGQGLDYAGIPTLELHIALLRDMIIASGAPLAEIPPVPYGYPFIACLTHDVDHPSIRRHKLDHTTLGFLYRATFGSLLRVFKGRATLSDLVRNWTAALKLPLIHLGLASDFWHRFQDYLRIEKGLTSSFFVIPFKGCPGQIGLSAAPNRRASGYGAADIGAEIQGLCAAGCEVGLHGIDAWCDTSSGRKELEEIRRITGGQEIGVRMHWLYFDEQSPLNLERAGATYDSTVGYNETVGYRAGTTQAYKPLQVSRLLELPLHIMDTALFYPDRLNLRRREAQRWVAKIIDYAGQFGGAITVNWHDRSIAPERHWGSFYESMLSELKSKGAWFSTAGQAVAWFRKRRSAVFETMSWEANTVHVKVKVQKNDCVPGLRLCLHNPRPACTVAGFGAADLSGDINVSLNNSIDTHLFTETSVDL